MVFCRERFEFTIDQHFPFSPSHLTKPVEQPKFTAGRQQAPALLLHLSLAFLAAADCGLLLLP
jgi:hypothetical protein